MQSGADKVPFVLPPLFDWVMSVTATPEFIKEMERARKRRLLRDRADAIFDLFLRERKRGAEGTANKEYARLDGLDILEKMGVTEHTLPDGRGVKRREDKPKLSVKSKVRAKQIQQLEQYAKRKFGNRAPKPILKQKVTVEEINPEFLKFIADNGDAQRRVRQIVPPVVKLCATGEACETDEESEK